MDQQRWQEIEQLYHAALEREPAERSAFLDQACHGDVDLRREVEALLAQDASGGKILDRPAAELLDETTVTQLGVGAQLGPYQIEAPIGAGGMGSVYRAIDTRLGRKVAIKIAAKQFTERFEREARAISSLNHPHICTLYDVGPNYLVMELVEGETLTARLKKGALSTELVLRYGAQIADALAAAHAKGIVHRDLKPGNIMVTKSGVKVLDFGLAKTQRDETLTSSRAIMGTPAYMAPEQREGWECDARTDIYALGLGLREMATGHREGTTSGLPPQLAHVIDRCLAIEPESRWQSARDLKAALDLIAVPSLNVYAPPKTSRRQRLISGLVAAVLLVAAAGYWLRQPPKEKPFRFSMLPPEGNSFLTVSQGGAPALSPDGLRIAFVAEGSSGRLLWVRSLDGFSARALAGTEGATSPFWSPDGHWIGFFAQGYLKKVDPEGGQAQAVSPATSAFLATVSGSWSTEDNILYYPADTASGNVLELVNASGGQPVQATSRNIELLDENLVTPHFLPDGRQYLLEVRGGPELDLSVWLGTLGSNERRLLLKGATNAQYAPPRLGAPGYLVFGRDGILMAQPFDAGQGALFGTAVTVAEHVAGGAPRVDFSVSPAGVLAYRTADPSPHEMVWYDRSGKVAGTIGDHPGNLRNNIRISPDGKSVAFTRQAGETQEVWIHDLIRGSSSRLTLNGGRSPIWSPDSSQIVFVRGDTIYRMPATGGAEAAVWRGPRLISANDLSGDGKYLLFTRWDERGVRQTWLLSGPLTGDSKNEPVLLANGIHSEFAPATGTPRWVSCDDDRGQVTVRGIPGEVSGPWQVSTDGGNGTRFRRDGREMYFASGQSFMAVDIEPGSPFRHGAPHVLFSLPRAIQVGQGQYAQGYDVNADGSRFLATFLAPETPPVAITVVRNWQAGLSK